MLRMFFVALFNSGTRSVESFSFYEDIETNASSYTDTEESYHPTNPAAATYSSLCRVTLGVLTSVSICS